MKKQILLILIAVAVIFSVMPMTALTAGANGTIHNVGNASQLATALNQLADGDIIQLTANIDYGDYIYIQNKSVTLDMNGFILNVMPSDLKMALGVENGSLTVIGGGELNLINPNEYGMFVYNATVEIYGYVFDYECDYDNNYTIVNISAGDMGIWAGENAKIIIVPIGVAEVEPGDNALNNTKIGAYDNDLNSTEDGTYGASVTGGINGIYAFNSAEVYINGSVLGGQYGVYSLNNAEVYIYGGDVTGDEVSGVYADYGAEVCVYGYEFNNSGNVSGRNGVLAFNGAEVIVYGSVLGTTENGVHAQGSALVDIYGDVTSSLFAGIQAGEDSMVYVLGNVSAKTIGVNVHRNSEVTVNGTLTVDENGYYIFLPNPNESEPFPWLIKTPNDFTSPTTKAGFLTYTDGINTVWVRGCEDCEKDLCECIGDDTLPCDVDGHKFGAWKITVTATSSREGSRERVCEICEYKETQTIAKTSGGGGGGGNSQGQNNNNQDNPAPNVTTAKGTTNIIVNMPITIINTINVNIPVVQLRIPTGATGNQSISVGADFAGQNAVLVRYNATTGEFEFVSAATVGTNGNANINVGQAGDYLVKTFKTGDITGTGTVETSDALAVLRDVAGITKLNGIQSYVANGKTGDNSTTDALNILRIVAGLI